MNHRILLITGTQNRHLSIASKIISKFPVDWIQYKRKLVPQEDKNYLSESDNNFLNSHLQNLQEDEVKAIGEYSLDTLTAKVINSSGRIISIKGRNELNSLNTIRWAGETEYDLAIDYGSGIISKDLIEAINAVIVNIHGGISPYYKGSSTLLYALLLSQPELVGMTIHKIDEGIDSGDIYKHVLPVLHESMRPTEVFAECQKQLILEINSIIEKIIKLEYLPQKQSKFGRTFMERDFRINALKSIYRDHEEGLLSDSIKMIKDNLKPYKLIL